MLQVHRFDTASGEAVIFEVKEDRTGTRLPGISLGEISRVHSSFKEHIWHSTLTFDFSSSTACVSIASTFIWHRAWCHSKERSSFECLVLPKARRRKIPREKFDQENFSLRLTIFDHRYRLSDLAGLILYSKSRRQQEHQSKHTSRLGNHSWWLWPGLHRAETCNTCR